jgi:hypothetical protein
VEEDAKGELEMSVVAATAQVLVPKSTEDMIVLIKLFTKWLVWFRMLISCAELAKNELLFQ